MPEDFIITSEVAQNLLGNDPILSQLSTGVSVPGSFEVATCSCGRPLVDVHLDAHLGAGALLVRELSAPWCPGCHRFRFAPHDLGATLGALITATESTLTLTRNYQRSGSWTDNGDRGRTVPVRVDAVVDAVPDVVVRDLPATYYASTGDVEIGAMAIAAAESTLRQVSAVHSYDGLTLSSDYGTGDHPRVLKVEPTTHCNLRCVFCSNPTLTARHRLSGRNFADVWSTVDSSRLFKVSFTGLGEALLNRDLWEMIELVAASGTPTSLVTNGTRLQANAAALISCGLDEVAVSIETLDAGDFARQRIGTSLDEVLGNIDGLIDAVKTSGSRLRINVLSVLAGRKTAGVDRVIDFCTERQLGPPHFYPLYDRFVPGDTTDTLSNAEALARFVELSGRAQQDGITLSPPREIRLRERAAGGRVRYSDLACAEPTSVFVLRADRTFACCNESIFSTEVVAGNPDRLPNVRSSWQGDELRAFRLALAVGAPHEVCRGCSAFEIPLFLAGVRR